MAVSTLFDGTDDRIVSTTGNNLTFNAYTWIAWLHLESLAGLDTWFSLDDGATSRFAPFMNGTDLGVEHATGDSATLVGAFADWGGWRSVGITHAAGTSTPVGHIWNGVSWVHSNLNATVDAPNGSIDELWIGGYANAASDFSDGECALVGLWAEDTNNATMETYLDYSTLAAKSNAQFFTGTSLLSGGTMNDIGAGNNDETARTGATTGVRHLPAWFTNFHTRSLPGVTAISQYVGTTGNPTRSAPTGATTGDLVIVIGATDTNSTFAVSTGWDILYNTASGTATRLCCAARVLDGGANDTLAITLAGGSNTNDFAFHECLIPAALHGVRTVTTDIEVGTAATGTSATPDPPNVTWTNGPRFILAMFGADDDDTSNAFMPANYAGLRQVRSATGTTSCMTASAFREITGATSENPGTFTMAASEEWAAGTLAIRGVRPHLRQPGRPPNALWVPRGRGRSNRSR